MTDIIGLARLPGMDYRKEIGARIRQARDRNKLSLKELAGRLDGLIKANAINMYEHGKRSPGVPEAVAIAKATGESAAYLLCVAGEDEMTKQELELLRNFRALDEKDRNSYARRIATIAMMHREPVPDEKLSSAWSAKTPTKPASRAKNPLRSKK